MCGIAGLMQNGGDRSETERCIRLMINALTRRGPDHAGVWLDSEADVALGHRRLSVLDLSQAGHQPMISRCRRYVLVLNGEIYNHRLLRFELDALKLAWSWRGHSDTETLLAGFSTWGVPETLKKSVGMFALALWDREKRTLFLARDRLGEKPLYYGWQGGKFFFGSELKALLSHPAFNDEIDRHALALFMRFAYVPSPYSIYRGIFKLMPGTYVKIKPHGEHLEQAPIPIPYWSGEEVCAIGQRDPLPLSDAEAIDAFEGLLRQVIAGQMQADVPLGAFLSGGVDSSTIVALMQSITSHPIQTFTIGFDEEGYNEAPCARAVATHLGTHHTELYVTAEQAMAVIPKLPSIYDEPFGDSSQIPTYLISRMTREFVTVGLSGDGGDELFGGYNRYFWVMALFKKLSFLPKRLREFIAQSVIRVSPRVWDSLLNQFALIIPLRWRASNPGDKVHKLAGVLSFDSPVDLYRHLISFWDDGVVIGESGRFPFIDEADWRRFDDFEHVMMALDLITYLPDDILVKLDRAAMAVSLEARVPFLDHRVVEFAWRLPLAMKIRNGQGKWLLRQVLYKYVPPRLIERPKQGFGVPLDAWLRGPLCQWAEDLLDPVRMKREGWLDAGLVRKKWTEHVSGRRNWSYYVWNALMFEAWMDSHE